MNQIDLNKYIDPLVYQLREKGIMIDREKVIKLFQKCPGTTERFWFHRGAKAISDLIEGNELPD